MILQLVIVKWNGAQIYYLLSESYMHVVPNNSKTFNVLTQLWYKLTTCKCDINKFKCDITKFQCDITYSIDGIT